MSYDVLAFGDSITQGYWDVEGGWLARIRRKFDQAAIDNNTMQASPLFYNFAVAAVISDDILPGFEAEARIVINKWPSIVIFGIGINDSRIFNGQPVSTPIHFKENLEKLHTLAKKYTNNIIFMGLTPCDERRTTLVPWGDHVYTNARIQEFDNVIKGVCTEQQAIYIDVMESFIENGKINAGLLIDGLHPNDAGRELMAKAVMAKLAEILK
ncbi:GDSL-type esterase/lipase family protein [Candidatus Saccharibacteria bacterium]|nr:GDSL-type esterase/lipase family protein [Candidatus Saccharibacteria bacterium]